MKRLFCIPVVAAVLAMSSCVSTDNLAQFDQAIETDIVPIRQVFRNDFKVGAAVEPEQLAGPEGALLRYHFNTLTPENAMKFKSIHPERGTYEFSRADAVIDFAKRYRMKVRGHTFVWHHPDEIAGWVFTDETGNRRTRDEVLAILGDHMKTLMKRYGKSVYAWDVVNEAVDEKEPDGMRRTPWYEALGPDYVAEAFRLARKISPKAKLFYNDYFFFDPVKGEALYKFIKGLKDAGVPIDGIGMQEHLTVVYPKIEAMRDTIKKFRELGLEIHITELDMSLYTQEFEVLESAPEDYLIHQAHRYRELFRLYRENKDVVKSVTFWGFNDGHTWLTQSTGKPDWPLPFDAEFRHKLAYTGIVGGELPPDVELVTFVPARVYGAKRGTPTVDGETDEVWSKAKTVRTDKKVMTKDGAYADVKLLWDDANIYVLAEVTDPTPSAKGTQVHEKDSFEVFFDENNGKTAAFEGDDYQLRVNNKGAMSWSGKTKGDQFTSAVVTTPTGYRVEMAVQYHTIKPAAGMKLGLELQVNDNQGTDSRAAIMKWNDPTNESYRNTSGWGTLELVE